MIALILVATLTAQTHNAQLETAALQSAFWRTYNDPLLRASEQRWIDYRTSACNYVYQAYSGGSIAPTLYSRCLADAEHARVRDIGLFTGLPNRNGAIVEPQVQAEERRVYGLLELRLSPRERDLLANSERAFVRYRTAACSHAKDGCATAITKTRTQQLKDSWLAEKFW